MNKYLITLLFITNLFSQVFDYRQSNRIRQDFMPYDKLVLEKTNYYDEEEAKIFRENSEIKKLIEMHSGKNVTSITQSTTFVVVGMKTYNIH